MVQPGLPGFLLHLSSLLPSQGLGSSRADCAATELPPESQKTVLCHHPPLSGPWQDQGHQAATSQSTKTWFYLPFHKPELPVSPGEPGLSLCLCLPALCSPRLA